MNQTKFRTIREILDAAGGGTIVSEACGQKLTVDAVRKWQHNGIPDRYWSAIIPLADSSAEELLAANQLVRAEKQVALA